ncbi:RNA polymerase sigma factor [Marinoscillum furvescens]|uniref:RNA polymerase sigma-70 factor (ECF subfamily) n=1 Tax=Marinoscillum furvescens DSM 4134 TaxID=1122208 RepID=A0A3D9L3K4_MARFU|nr:sigma-70 family RNA polymerase sigma factor [Marinoscillum furvescens]RED97863.1 RNA polymerase sigma-70 factor (ECF subfamily) [Marinoscillum furvescens DSM 4134]
MEKDVCSEKVFSELFKNYSEELYKFLYYKYGAQYNPRDLVQDAFSKLWDNCKKVLPEKARGFLFTVANNLTLNVISRQKTAWSYEQLPHSGNTNESPEYVMEEAEYMDQLQEALDSLTEEQRVTFMLNRVEGKKHQEIADMLGISRKAVEKRIYKALAILREKVEGL